MSDEPGGTMDQEGCESQSSLGSISPFLSIHLEAVPSPTLLSIKANELHGDYGHFVPDSHTTNLSDSPCSIFAERPPSTFLPNNMALNPNNARLSTLENSSLKETPLTLPQLNSGLTCAATHIGFGSSIKQDVPSIKVEPFCFNRDKTSDRLVSFFGKNKMDPAKRFNEQTTYLRWKHAFECNMYHRKAFNSYKRFQNERMSYRRERSLNILNNQSSTNGDLERVRPHDFALQNEDIRQTSRNKSAFFSVTPPHQRVNELTDPALHRNGDEMGMYGYDSSLKTLQMRQYNHIIDMILDCCSKEKPIDSPRIQKDQKINFFRKSKSCSLSKSECQVLPYSINSNFNDFDKPSTSQVEETEMFVNQEDFQECAKSEAECAATSASIVEKLKSQFNELSQSNTISMKFTITSSHLKAITKDKQTETDFQRNQATQTCNLLDELEDSGYDDQMKTDT